MTTGESNGTGEVTHQTPLVGENPGTVEITNVTKTDTTNPNNETATQNDRTKEIAIATTMSDIGKQPNTDEGTTGATTTGANTLIFSTVPPKPTPCKPHHPIPALTKDDNIHMLFHMQLQTS